MKDIDQAIADLVRRGAAFSRPPGDAPIAVAFFRRVGPKAWFWWDATGVTEFHAHGIEPERVEVLYDGDAVVFWTGDEMVGCLTPLAESFDDPAPAASWIKDWRAEFDRRQELRKFVADMERNAFRDR